MVHAYELGDGALRLRPPRASDLAALLAVLQHPSVARWWGEYDLGRVQAEILDDDDVIVFVVESEGLVAGFVQVSEEPDPDYRHAGIDIALGPQAQGRGLGPAAIRLIARWLFAERGHHRITIDPAAANRNAIRAYERVGFRAVGIMRQYERGPDGALRDGLLMDLLKDELT